MSHVELVQGNLVLFRLYFLYFSIHLFYNVPLTMVSWSVFLSISFSVNVHFLPAVIT